MVVAGGDETSLEFTPTWVVAVVSFSIVFISITVEKLFHCAGQRLKNRKWWPFTVASRKIKDELMLLGLISLLLAVFQTRIVKICISEQLANTWLPCKKPNSSSTVASFTTSSFASSGTQGRHLLTIATETTNYCSPKRKVPLLSVEAVHQLHIFIFVLATFHVVLCLLKVLSMRCQWSRLEIYEENLKADVGWQDRVLKYMAKSYENPPDFFVAMVLAMQQQLTSITVMEYLALRLNFIWAGESKDPVKKFQKYITRTLQKEFQKMIRISWYLWLVAVIFLLMNVAGWHALFWISFIPFILWLVLHFQLEGMIRRLTKEVAERHTTNKKASSESDAKEMVVEISKDDFWFGRPGLVGELIHFVLFENSLQLTFFFFIWLQYGFQSCIMGKVGFVVPRIVIGVIVQFVCTFRTIPLYAIMKSQMRLKEKYFEIAKELLEEFPFDALMNMCCDAVEEFPVVEWLQESGMDFARILEEIQQSSPEEAADIEPTRTGSREGPADGAEITESSDVNSAGDIEAQKDNQARTNSGNK